MGVFKISKLLNINLFVKNFYSSLFILLITLSTTYGQLSTSLSAIDVSRKNQSSAGAYLLDSILSKNANGVLYHKSEYAYDSNGN